MTRFPVQVRVAALVAALASLSGGGYAVFTERHTGGVVAAELAAYDALPETGPGIAFCEDMISAAVIWSGHGNVCFCAGVRFHVHAASTTFAGVQIKAYQATLDMAARSSPSIRRALTDAFDHDIYGTRFLNPVSARELARRGEVRLCRPRGAK